MKPSEVVVWGTNKLVSRLRQEAVFPSLSHKPLAWNIVPASEGMGRSQRSSCMNPCMLQEVASRAGRVLSVEASVRRG